MSGVILLTLLVAGIVIWFQWKDGRGGKASGASGFSGNTQKSERTDLASDSLSVDPPVDPVEEGLVIDDPTFTFDEFVTKFESSKSERESFAIYTALRDRLLSMNEEAAAKLISDYLNSGKDVNTDLGFAVGPDGVLETAPTLRTLLLDLLMQFDPAGAVDFARDLIANPASADEYAMALRNLAWYDLKGDMRVEVGSAFSAMLDQTKWLSSPSDGFLEAFDLAIFVGNEQAVLDLASVINLEDDDGTLVENGVSRAAFMALDRLALENPDLLLSMIERDPEFLEHAPRQRASIMARLDVREPGRGAAILKYLNSGIPAEEIRGFAKAFPNQNFSFGNRLVSSQEESNSIAEVLEIDKASLKWVRNSLNKGSSEEVTNAIASIGNRLERYIADAKKRGGDPTEVPPLE